MYLYTIGTSTCSLFLQEKTNKNNFPLPAKLSNKAAISCTTQQARNKQTTRNTGTICPAGKEVKADKKDPKGCQTKGTS